jgi:benzoylformate decarboxylase
LPTMSGSQALLALLKQEGVKFLFGNPGTTELPLLDLFAADKEVRYVLGLQEAAVVAMADGYAQASGNLTVVNLHLAPGLGNAMGMLYNAQKAASPILLTAGQQDQSFNATEPILWADVATNRFLCPIGVFAVFDIRQMGHCPRAEPHGRLGGANG